MVTPREQRGLTFGGRSIDEALTVRHVEDGLPFGGTQRARRRCAYGGVDGYHQSVSSMSGGRGGIRGIPRTWHP